MKFCECWPLTGSNQQQDYSEGRHGNTTVLRKSPVLTSTVFKEAAVLTSPVFQKAAAVTSPVFQKAAVLTSTVPRKAAGPAEPRAALLLLQPQG